MKNGRRRRWSSRPFSSCQYQTRRHRFASNGRAKRYGAGLAPIRPDRATPTCRVRLPAACQWLVVTAAAARLIDRETRAIRYFKVISLSLAPLHSCRPVPGLIVRQDVHLLGDRNPLLSSLLASPKCRSGTRASAPLIRPPKQLTKSAGE